MNEPLRFTRGQQIYKEGEDADFVYIVFVGSFELTHYIGRDHQIVSKKAKLHGIEKN